MLNAVFATLLLLSQLTGPGAALPQILHPSFKAATPLMAGKKGDVIVSFNVLEGYSINRIPPITLKLTAIPGVSLEKTDFTTPSTDPKSKDEYYAVLPKINVAVNAAKAGSYEIPGKLVYFFCSKSDGFCSRQVLDVKIPVTIQ
jgi:hypothetical protein